MSRTVGIRPLHCSGPEGRVCVWGVVDTEGCRRVVEKRPCSFRVRRRRGRRARGPPLVSVHTHLRPGSLFIYDLVCPGGWGATTSRGTRPWIRAPVGDCSRTPGGPRPPHTLLKAHPTSDRIGVVVVFLTPPPSPHTSPSTHPSLPGRRSKGVESVGVVETECTVRGEEGVEVEVSVRRRRSLRSTVGSRDSSFFYVRH